MPAYELHPDREPRALGRALLATLCLLCASCGGAGSSAATTAASGDAPATRTRTSAPAAGPRQLEASSSFGALAALAAELDQTPEADSSEGCLLGGGGSSARPLRLAADLAVGVRPLPAAPPLLGARVAGALGAPRVLSVWGSRGDGELGLVVFTSTPPLPDGPLTVLALTERGVFLRRTGESAPVTPPFPPAELPTRLAEIPELGALIITADGSMPLLELRALLASLPPRGAPVALAVALPEGTRLPDPALPISRSEGSCPDGLAAPPVGTPEGSLTPAAVRSALDPFLRDAPSCLAVARHGAAGGRFELAVRIESDGHVGAACAMTDSARDDDLRACLLRRLASIRFPTPEPAGVVDFALPITLGTEGFVSQRPLCD